MVAQSNEYGCAQFATDDGCNADPKELACKRSTFLKCGVLRRRPKRTVFIHIRSSRLAMSLNSFGITRIDHRFRVRHWCGQKAGQVGPVDQ